MSSLFASSISDREITRPSGIVDNLEPGDSVMTDEGFLIGDILAYIEYSSFPNAKRPV